MDYGKVVAQYHNTRDGKQNHLGQPTKIKLHQDKTLQFVINPYQKQSKKMQKDVNKTYLSPKRKQLWFITQIMQPLSAANDKQ